ncbi:MAG: ribonuclease HI family protein [Tepidisphaerales bacterium]
MPIRDVITVRFDGGSRGNPGPAAAGIVLEAEDGTVLQARGVFLGHATNNVAEYRGLLAGLQAARQLGATRVKVRGDSELVIKQLLGEYRVKNESLKPLHEKAVALLRQFDSADIGHNTREHNELADRLANLALDRGRDVTDDELPEGGSRDRETGHVQRASDAVPRPGQRWVCSACGLTVRVERGGQGRSASRPLTCPCGRSMRLAE